MHKMPEMDNIVWKFKSSADGSSYKVTTPWISIRNDDCFNEVRPYMKRPKIGMPTAPDEEEESGMVLENNPFFEPPVRQTNIKDYWKLAINPRHVFSPPKRVSSEVNKIIHTSEECKILPTISSQVKISSI